MEFVLKNELVAIFTPSVRLHVWSRAQFVALYLLGHTDTVELNELCWTSDLGWIQVYGTSAIMRLGIDA